MPQNAVEGQDGPGENGSHNFPLRLNIKPLEVSSGHVPSTEQAKWIKEYGIAGRVWEAVPYLMQYLTPPDNEATAFDPPCSLFQGDADPPRILELGSGNGYLVLHHLASILPPGSKVVMTDLDEVVPLLEGNIMKAPQLDAKISVQAVPWGSRSHVDTLHETHGSEYFSHILCSDLVYFTHLLEPLLQTLLWLTEHEASPDYTGCRKEVIFGYKVRGAHKEGAFWETLGAFFELEVVNRSIPSLNDGDDDMEPPPSPFEEDRLLILLARRKKNRPWMQGEGKALMSYKDDQFEGIVMLKLFRGI